MQQVVFSSMDDHKEKYKALGLQLPEAEKGRIIPMHESKTEIAVSGPDPSLPYVCTCVPFTCRQEEP